MARRGSASAARPVDGRMPLVEHLYELRQRLGRSLLAIFVAVVVAFIFWEPLYEFLKQPYCDTRQAEREGCDLVALRIFDQFKVRLRVSFLAGVVAASPVWLYQLGAFITPALHRQEKKYAAAFLAASLTLFSVGAVFAYLTVARGLDFLLTVGGGEIVTLLNVQDYLSFVTLCLIAFGIAFEFPVVVMFLHFAGVLSSEKMRGARRGTVLGVFVAAALITPSQDPFTFCFMALPLLLLYEGCIVIARVHERALRRKAVEEGFAGLDDDTASPLDLPRSSA